VKIEKEFPPSPPSTPPLSKLLKQTEELFPPFSSYLKTKIQQ